MRIKDTIPHTVTNIICLLQLIGIVIYLIIAWNNIPEQIPAHFDASGAVTRYGNKNTLFTMTIIAWISFALMSLIERFPQIWNTGVRVTEENKFRVYRIIKSLLLVTKLMMVTMFVYITIMQSLSRNVHAWFMPLFIFMFVGESAYFIVKLIRAR